jgi:hypothetical protein
MLKKVYRHRRIGREGKRHCTVELCVEVAATTFPVPQVTACWRRGRHASEDHVPSRVLQLFVRCGALTPGGIKAERHQVRFVFQWARDTTMAP